MNNFDQLWYEYQQREDRKSNAAVMVMIGLTAAACIGIASAFWGMMF